MGKRTGKQLSVQRQKLNNLQSSNDARRIVFPQSHNDALPCAPPGSWELSKPCGGDKIEITHKLLLS